MCTIVIAAFCPGVVGNALSARASMNFKEDSGGWERGGKCGCKFTCLKVVEFSVGCLQ